MNILIITKLYADWRPNHTMKNQLLTTIFLGDIGEGTVYLMHYTFVIELDSFSFLIIAVQQSLQPDTLRTQFNLHSFDRNNK